METRKYKFRAWDKKLNKMWDRAGFSAVPVADGRLEVHMPEDLKNKLLDNEKLAEIWVRVRTALKELADANIPMAPNEERQDEQE